MYIYLKLCDVQYEFEYYRYVHISTVIFDLANIALAFDYVACLSK